MYNESETAREAKALIKQHLHLPDGVAQGHVDALDEVHLADLVASRDYPPHDRPAVIRDILARGTLTVAPAVPPEVAAAAAVPADPAPPEEPEPAARKRRPKPE